MATTPQQADFQKSARCYKRLAETNIVNGDWSIARKYLKALQHARFYKKWASETLALLDSGDIFERRPELEKARESGRMLTACAEFVRFASETLQELMRDA